MNKLQLNNKGFTKTFFAFADDKPYVGYVNGSTWNGFDNVWVTKDVFEKITSDFGAEESRECGLNDIIPNEDGLYSFAYGFATTIYQIDELDDYISQQVTAQEPISIYGQYPKEPVN